MPTRRSDTMRAVDAVMPLVDEFNLLDEGDKLTFLDLVDPLPEKHDHRPKKKASKKSSKSQSSSKSPRASGMATVLNRNMKQRETTKDGSYDDDLLPAAGACEDCNYAQDHNIHHLTKTTGYHPFVSTAPPAPAPSSANGGVGSTTANSEIVKDAASNVAHGASGGD